MDLEYARAHTRVVDPAILFVDKFIQACLKYIIN